MSWALNGVFTSTSLALSIIWEGLPTHVHKELNVTFIVALFLFVAFAYFFVHGNLVENVVARFSQYIFGNSKRALTTLFKKISGNVVYNLFVPITLGSSILLVGISYPERHHVVPDFSAWAVFSNIFIIALGTGVVILWSVTGKILSPSMPVLIALLFVAYGVLRSFFGAAVFECVLDKALCYMLLFVAAIMEVLSGLHMISGVRFFGRNVPLLEPRTFSWAWWALRLFAFQMVSVIAHCAPRGVGIGAAYLVVMREYFLVIVCMGLISNVLPRIVSRFLRWGPCPMAWADPIFWLLVSVEIVVCVCACGWGELLGNHVAQTPSKLDSEVTAMLNWGVRLAIMGAFSFTLSQLSGLVKSFLTSKLNITLNSILKLRSAFRCLSPKDVVTSVVCPKDFRAKGALRSTLDAIKTGFTNFANTKNPIAFATALKKIKNLSAIKFDKDQILRMQIQARFQFPVSGAVVKEALEAFELQSLALIIQRHMPTVSLVNIVEALRPLVKVEIFQQSQSGEKEPIAFRPSGRNLPQTKTPNDVRLKAMRGQLEDFKSVEDAAKAVDSLIGHPHIDEINDAVDTFIRFMNGTGDTDFPSFLLDVSSAWGPCLEIFQACGVLYRVESDLGDRMCTLLLKAMLESSHSVSKSAVESMEEVVSNQWTGLRKVFGYGNPLLRIIDKIKSFQLLGGGLQWMQGQLFNARYGADNHDDDDDAEFFETGTVVCRCEVHLDILVAVCQDLYQLGQRKYSAIAKELAKPLASIFPKTANKFSHDLKRLTHLVSYGDSSMPLDALNALFASVKRAQEETIISQATKAASNLAEKARQQENQVKLLKMMWSEDNGEKLSAQVQRLGRLVNEIRQACGLPDESKNEGKNESKNESALVRWLASAPTPLGEDVKEKLVAAGWTDDNFSTKTAEDIPDTVIGGFQNRLQKLIDNSKQ